MTRGLLTDFDLHLFNEGSHSRLHDKMGAHPVADGCHFAVWAPNARSVHVIGDFNDWDKSAVAMELRGDSGIWEAFVKDARVGQRYKYHIRSRFKGYKVDKADPFGFYHEQSPATGSVIWPRAYEWGDAAWLKRRAKANAHREPMSIYELHLGSWRLKPEEGNRWLTYRELAPLLVDYCREMAYTHVEFMPVMEHPFGGSWGYQITGYFAPTSRYGSPQDFMHLVDTLHQAGIGVVLDWAPSHFPADEHGLKFFDGSHLFEHADPRQGHHPDWDSAIFNYGRNEVRSFLLSSAFFWLEFMHADALRVDAVASMIHLDYSRQPGQWIPNKYGGNENLEAISFLRRLNEDAYREIPGVQIIAEESTAWPMVSRPVYLGGLGFGFKWDMGWMNDVLKYMALDPVHRRYHQNDITFRSMYQYAENFVLPLSHDEVVHEKSTLIGKMPGDEWQKFANLRLLHGCMFAQPGKKLLFMGGELAQWREWDYETSLDWHLLQYPPHQGVQRWVADLNRFYAAEPAMHRLDCEPGGFQWVDCADADQSILTFLRLDGQGRQVLAVFNFTPVPRHGYNIGVDVGGPWVESLNSDASQYGGSGLVNGPLVEAWPGQVHGRPYHLSLTLSPLALMLLRPAGQQ